MSGEETRVSVVRRIGRVDAQRLEEDAEEPREEDVAGHEPSQLFAILFTVANRHLGINRYTRLRTD